MSNDKDNAYGKAHRNKTVFWQSDSQSSRWRKLARTLTRELKPGKPRKFRALRD